AAEQHADAVLSLHHAAVVAEIVQPGLRILGDPMSRSRIGRVVEAGRRDRDRQAAQTAAWAAEFLAGDHDLLAGAFPDQRRCDLVGQRGWPDRLDLFELALHAERVDLFRTGERADQHRNVVSAAVWVASGPG